jgi:hypothetical protein
MPPRSRPWPRSVAVGRPTRTRRWSRRTNDSSAKTPAKLLRKLRQTEVILDVQEELSEILGIELPPNDYEREP